MQLSDTCVRCGSPLKPVDVDGGPRPTSDSVHYHYRCDTAGCDADGGTVVVEDGVIQRRVGGAVDASYARAGGAHR
jgi:hypothetical protein